MNTTRRDGKTAGVEEYRYYEKALAAGVTMMPSRLIETKAGTFFATKRFDRTNTGGRLHFASAAGLLHADYRTPGDEYLLLFKLMDALLHDHSAKEELFRRVTLNVLEHNRDDHLKNFGFLMDAEGHWSLAPFYDFTYSDGPNGWQTLSVAGIALGADACKEPDHDHAHEDEHAQAQGAEVRVSAVAARASADWEVDTAWTRGRSRSGCIRRLGRRGTSCRKSAEC